MVVWCCLHLAYDLFLVLLHICLNTIYDETLLTWQSDICSIFHMVSTFHCIASNLVKCLLLSLHIIVLVISSVLFFIHITSSYHVVVQHQSSVRLHHASICFEELNCYSFFLSAWLNMAQRKRKKHRMAGNEKRMNPVDSAGTDGAIEGQSPAENSTNTASHAKRVAKKPNRNK